VTPELSQEAFAEPTSPANRARPPPEDLSPLQIRGLQLLVSGQTMVAVAEEIGVNARTISRWFKEEAFAGAYRAQVTELQLELWNHMLAVRNEAWGRFMQLLNSDDERIALRATVWTLERMLQARGCIDEQTRHWVGEGVTYSRSRPIAAARKLDVSMDLMSGPTRLRQLRGRTKAPR
jgi:hypothetical protein